MSLSSSIGYGIRILTIRLKVQPLLTVNNFFNFWSKCFRGLTTIIETRLTNLSNITKLRGENDNFMWGSLLVNIRSTFYRGCLCNKWKGCIWVQFSLNLGDVCAIPPNKIVSVSHTSGHTPLILLKSHDHHIAHSSMVGIIFAAWNGLKYVIGFWVVTSSHQGLKVYTKTMQCIRSIP